VIQKEICSLVYQAKKYGLFPVDIKEKKEKDEVKALI